MAPQSTTTNGLVAPARSRWWIASAACPLPVPVSPSSSTVASLRSRPLHQRERHARRNGHPVHLAERRAIRQQQAVAAVGGLEPQLRRAEPDQAAVAKERLLDLNTVDDRAVQAAEIDDLHAVAGDADLAVEAGDRLIGDLQVVARRRSPPSRRPRTTPTRRRTSRRRRRSAGTGRRSATRRGRPRAAWCRAAPRRRHPCRVRPLGDSPADTNTGPAAWRPATHAPGGRP